MKIKETSPVYGIPKKLFTYQDYLDLPEDGKRYEVINGELVMAPAPSTGHQSVSVNLVLALGNFFERHKYGKMFSFKMFIVFLSDEPGDLHNPHRHDLKLGNIELLKNESQQTLGYTVGLNDNKRRFFHFLINPRILSRSSKE